MMPVLKRKTVPMIICGVIVVILLYIKMAPDQKGGQESLMVIKSNDKQHPVLIKDNEDPPALILPSILKPGHPLERKQDKHVPVQPSNLQKQLHVENYLTRVSQYSLNLKSSLTLRAEISTSGLNSQKSDNPVPPLPQMVAAQKLLMTNDQGQHVPVDMEGLQRLVMKHDRNPVAHDQFSFLKAQLPGMNRDVPTFTQKQLPVQPILRSNVKVYTYNNGWKMNTTVCKGLEHLKGRENFQKRLLNTVYNGDINMYLHDPSKDYVSKNVATHRLHDKYVFLSVWKHIKDYPDVNFIDIGANLGVFSLQIANLGRKVISIEASYECVQRECASIQENHFENRLAIVHNAVGFDHNIDAKFIMTKGGDFGTSFVENKQQKESAFKHYGRNSFSNTTIVIKTVTLDDLLDIPKFHEHFKSVFVKIDVEGFEHKALEGAKRFFKEIDVRGVYMEWDWHRYKPTAPIIVQYMTNLNFIAYDCDAVVQQNIDSPCPAADLINPLTSGNVNIVWIRK